jgi:hypothetical protein
MKTTIHTCDKCKLSKAKEDIIVIDISYYIGRPNKNFYNVKLSRDLCKSCLVELGLLTELSETATDEDLKKNDKTLESKFIDLLCDLGVVFE